VEAGEACCWERKSEAEGNGTGEAAMRTSAKRPPARMESSHRRSMAVARGAAWSMAGMIG
jgi:hypothetical protein